MEQDHGHMVVAWVPQTYSGLVPAPQLSPFRLAIAYYLM